MDQASRYFLYGYFGTGNFGDDVLLYTAVKNILARDPDAHFLLRNYGPVNLEKYFPGRIECTYVEKIHNLSWPSLIKFFILIRAYWEYIGKVSHLVVGGGTLIHDSPGLKSTFLLLCLCLIAKIRGRHIFGIGLGSQKIETIPGKIIIRLLVATFDKLCLRDQPSYNQIHSLSGKEERIKLTTDLAYALPAEGEPHRTDKIIAVTLADYLLERLDQSTYEAAITTLAKALTRFIKQGYHIRLIPLQKESVEFGVTGDTVSSEHLKARIVESEREKTKIVTIEANPESIAAAYNGVCLVIGMRFHSLIFSAIKHIPFVGLSDEPKISAICTEFLMPCFAAHAWDEHFISQAIENSIKSEIDPALIENYRQLAQDNFEFVS